MFSYLGRPCLCEYQHSKLLVVIPEAVVDGDVYWDLVQMIVVCC